MNHAPKPSSVGLIRLSSPHPGLTTISAPSALFRAVGQPSRHADHLTHTSTMAASEADRVVAQMVAQLMADDIVAEVRRTGGYCDHAALRRHGWSDRIIRRLSGLAKEMAAPRIGAVGRTAA